MRLARFLLQSCQSKRGIGSWNLGAGVMYEPELALMGWMHEISQSALAAAVAILGW